MIGWEGFHKSDEDKNLYFEVIELLLHELVSLASLNVIFVSGSFSRPSIVAKWTLLSFSCISTIDKYYGLKSFTKSTRSCAPHWRRLWLIEPMMPFLGGEWLEILMPPWTKLGGWLGKITPHTRFVAMDGHVVMQRRGEGAHPNHNETIDNHLSLSWRFMVVEIITLLPTQSSQPTSIAWVILLFGRTPPLTNTAATQIPFQMFVVLKQVISFVC